jgi:hypothetical protein
MWNLWIQGQLYFKCSGLNNTIIILPAVKEDVNSEKVSLHKNQGVVRAALLLG